MDYKTRVLYKTASDKMIQGTALNKQMPKSENSGLRPVRYLITLETNFHFHTRTIGEPIYPSDSQGRSFLELTTGRFMKIGPELSVYN